MSGFYDSIYIGDKCDLEIQRNSVVKYIFSQNMAVELRLEKGRAMKGNIRKC